MQKRIIDAILRRDLSAFIEKAFHTVNPSTEFLPNWHVEKISGALQKVSEGKTKRLIINIPPRYLKSICVNVAWPAWILGNDSTKKIISASFNQNLATKHSIDSRLVMNAEWYKNIFPNFKFASDQNEKTKFATTQRGFRFAVSVFGSVTGEGGDILIIDDPMSPEIAASRLEREKVIAWFDQTFSTRLDDKKNGAIVLVMQRLHEDDLSGVLLRRGGWEHLNLPVMDTRGKLLHEAREGEDEIRRIKSDLGEYGFAAQYMQAPMKIENGMIKRIWLKFYKKQPLEFDQIYQSWDTAIKSHANADFSVGITFGVFQNDIYVLDIAREQMEYPDLKRLILAMSYKWKSEAILIEDKASGQSLLQDLRRETKLPLISINPKRDKVTRMSAVSPLIESGRLFLPRQLDWARDFEAELLSFPNSKNDDQVDALSQFLGWYKSHESVSVGVREI